MIKKLIQDEKGMAAVFAAAIMPFLLAFAGLFVDTGYMIYNKIQLEAAVEAAAAATKDAYDLVLWEEEGRVVLDSVKAQELAKRYLAMNFPEAQIKTCTVDPVKLNEVTVTATVEVKPLFMKLFGVESKTIQATVYNHVG